MYYQGLLILDSSSQILNGRTQSNAA